MFKPNILPPAPERPLPPEPDSRATPEPKQRRMMIIALALLVMALGIVLYGDRNFWFPDTQEAEDQPLHGAPAAAKTASTATSRMASRPSSPVVRPNSSSAKAPISPKDSTARTPVATSQAAPPPATVTRTVLPPLEVEVVAGNVHQTVRPGSNAVHVELQAGAPTVAVPDQATNESGKTSPSLTPAAERVQMSADTSEVVTHAVKPGYPLLARQMKVQGSVILQALISRDGDIQGLHVVSGPQILAGAAQEAVRQWRFKPHYQGAETVETQAKITVNFTISTN